MLHFSTKRAFSLKMNRNSLILMELGPGRYKPLFKGPGGITLIGDYIVNTDLNSKFHVGTLRKRTFTSILLGMLCY